VPPIPGDIVVTTNGGAPLDQNLYQCVKGLTTAEATAKPGATIILCAEMADGIGGDQFYQDMRDCQTPAQLYAKFAATPQDKTVRDQWQTQILCRVMMKHRVIFVTRPEMQTVIEQMKMEYAPDLQSALRMAGDGEITAIPDGISVCICDKQ
jgi:nickel-dependent lactate racemase